MAHVGNFPCLHTLSTLHLPLCKTWKLPFHQYVVFSQKNVTQLSVKKYAFKISEGNLREQERTLTYSAESKGHCNSVSAVEPHISSLRKVYIKGKDCNYDNSRRKSIQIYTEYIHQQLACVKVKPIPCLHLLYMTISFWSHSSLQCTAQYFRFFVFLKVDVLGYYFSRRYCHQLRQYALHFFPGGTAISWG